ncbi:hypothetical protein BDZ45DRAFT_215113 [Acephala macrosclerotiorum]|nr:hypothetical protein BDZ45DRAFT_215113 [Acephala macrosclerotiorum]
MYCPKGKSLALSMLCLIFMTILSAQIRFKTMSAMLPGFSQSQKYTMIVWYDLHIHAHGSSYLKCP